MSPSCLEPNELAAQVLFAEQEVGRLHVELQASHRRNAQLEGQLQVVLLQVEVCILLYSFPCFVPDLSRVGMVEVFTLGVFSNGAKTESSHCTPLRKAHMLEVHLPALSYKVFELTIC
jgi:hypothetical protein